MEKYLTDEELITGSANEKGDAGATNSDVRAVIEFVQENIADIWTFGAGGIEGSDQIVAEQQ
ncbi:hypothetical protein [Paraburkholderia bonniea]|uniref:hypothetical protein n=1 Tax=Paraburkholderia bonniea TaxID=2152891 RepID=UPI001291C199|nr:hypothetical protein [Paraburkholderia bonniea]